MSNPISINLLLGALEPVGAGCPGTFDPDPLFIQFGGLDNQWTSFTSEEENYHVYDNVVDGLGNIIVAGEMTTTSVTINQAFVAKFSSSGNLLWRKFFNRTGASGNSCGAMSLAVDNLGNVYAAGYHRLDVPTPTAHRENYPFVVKFDCQGEQVWAQGFSTDGPYDGFYDFFVESMTFHDGHLYALFVEDYSKTYLMKLDPSGSVVFKKCISTPVEGDGMYGFGIEADLNGDLLIAGSNWSMNRLYFAKFDDTGTNIWFRAAEYPDGLYEYKNGFAVAPNGSVAVCTVGGNDEIGVVIYDTDGDLVMNKLANFGLFAYSPQWTRCTFNTSNELIMCGDLIGYNSIQRHLFKLDISGNLAWQRLLLTGCSDFTGNSHPGRLHVKDGLMYVAAGAMSDGYNRHNYLGIAKLPVEPIGNVRFGGYMSYHVPQEFPWQISVTTGTFVDTLNAATVYSFNFDDSSPMTAIGGAYTITETDQTADGVSTVLPMNVYPTLTGDSWSALWAQDDFVTDSSYYYAGGQSSVADSTGNVYIAGYYDDPTAFARVYVTKLSPTGVVLWQKYYQPAGGIREVFLDVDSSNNLYLGMRGAPTPGNWTLSKWDSSGTILWARQIVITGSACYGVKTTATGVYFFGNGAPPNGILYKYDFNGNLLYGKNFTLTTPNGAAAEVDVGNIIEESDGVVVCGEVIYESAAAGWNFYICKLSLDLSTVIWSHIYGCDSIRRSTDTAYSLTKDSTGNYYIVGGTNDGDGLDPYVYRMMLVKFTSGGVKLWERKWHAPGGIALNQFNGGSYGGMGSDNHLYIGAFTNIPSFGDNYARDGTQTIAKFDTDGDLVSAWEIYPAGDVQMNMVASSFRNDRFYMSSEYYGDRYGAWIASLNVSAMPDGVFGRWFVRPFTLFTESNILATEVTGPVNNPTNASYTTSSPSYTSTVTSVVMDTFVQPLS